MNRDRIIIADLLARGTIGINEAERRTRQDVLVNVVLHTDVRPAALSDDPRDIIDYRAVARSLMAHVESSRYRLLEALAVELARICVVEHGAARAVVRVEKPGAVRFSRSVGVEVDRAREDFGD